MQEQKYEPIPMEKIMKMPLRVYAFFYAKILSQVSLPQKDRAILQRKAIDALGTADPLEFALRARKKGIDLDGTSGFSAYDALEIYHTS